MITQGLFSFCAALGFGILMQVRGKNLFFAALGGMVGWLIYMGLTPLISADVVRYFIAAVAVSHYAQQMAYWRKTPALVFLAIALIPLVPGYVAYQAIIGLLIADMTQFATASVYTFQVILAIATGFLISSNVIPSVRWTTKKLAGK